MSDKIETLLLEYLMGEGEIMTEEAIVIQEAEKRFYEDLVIGSDMILTDGNRLINGRRNRLWDVSKKSGTMVSKSIFGGSCRSCCTAVSIWKGNWLAKNISLDIHKMNMQKNLT